MSDIISDLNQTIATGLTWCVDHVATLALILFVLLAVRWLVRKVK